MSLEYKKRLVNRALHVETRLGEHGVGAVLLGLDERSFWIEVRTNQEERLAQLVRELYVKWSDVESAYVSIWGDGGARKSICVKFAAEPEFGAMSQDDDPKT